MNTRHATLVYHGSARVHAKLIVGASRHTFSIVSTAGKPSANEPDKYRHGSVRSHALRRLPGKRIQLLAHQPQSASRRASLMSGLSGGRMHGVSGNVMTTHARVADYSRRHSLTISMFTTSSRYGWVAVIGS